MLGKAGRVDDVGARRGVRPQAANRIVEVVAVVKKVLGARRQHEAALPRRRGGRRNARDGELEIVDRIVRIARRVLDRAAGQPGVGG